MSDARPFGRRQAAPAPKSRAATPRPAEPAKGLTAEAEAFRAELVASRAAPTALTDWRRSLLTRQITAWLITLAFMSPGLLCLLFQAPLAVSGGLEIAGLAVNAWLRRARRRRLSEIVAWEDPAGA